MMKQNKWKQNFFTIWSGQAISLITSEILQMSIIFYLTDKTGSAMVLSMASLAGFLPQAVFGPMIGVMVDRLSRKHVMIGADIIIALAGAALAVIAIYMDIPIWMIYIVLFIRSIGTAFHSPALSASTPMLVPEDQLTKCAGYSQSIQSVGAIISPAAAAFLYSVWDLNKIIGLDVLGAVIACIAVATINIPNPEKSVNVEKTDFMLEMKEGYRAIHENKGLFSLLWIGTLYVLVYIPISSLFPLMSMQYFGGTAAHASAAETAFAAGMLGGGVVLSIWGGFKKRTLSISVSILMMGISLAISGMLPVGGFLAFVVCCVLMGVSSPFYGVQTALFQEKVKPEYLGRVFSLLGSIMSLAMPVGLIISGLFAEKLGVNNWFFISGAVIIAIALMSFVLPSIKELNNN